jgi:predicted ArsR family transcriptional regulator
MTNFTPLTVDVILRLRNATDPLSVETIAKKDHMTIDQVKEQLEFLKEANAAHEVKGGWVSRGKKKE